MSLPARLTTESNVQPVARRTPVTKKITVSIGTGTTLLGLILIAIVGLTVGRGRPLPTVCLTIAMVAIALGLRSWRWSIYALLAYLPVSGIPVLALYPDTRAAVLAKDVLFVMPAYIGFVVNHLANRRRMTVPGAPFALLIGLSVLVIAQMFNPSLPSGLVGAIGAKVWLFYIPLLVLGYHLVRSRSDLSWLLGLMSTTAILPALIGIV